VLRGHKKTIENTHLAWGFCNQQSDLGGGRGLVVSQRGNQQARTAIRQEPLGNFEETPSREAGPQAGPPLQVSSKGLTEVLGFLF